MNIIQIIGRHSPLLAAALEHNKPVEINPENVKTAINELLKIVLEEYTNRIVENYKLIWTSEIEQNAYEDRVWLDEESIASQLPEFLKEIGYE